MYFGSGIFFGLNLHAQAGIKGVYMSKDEISGEEGLDMEQYFQDSLEKDYWLQDLTETYFMCRQLNYGDVGFEERLKTDFQTMYDHVYVSQGGCAWCQNRIALKRKNRISEDKYEFADQELAAFSKVISLS